MGEWGLDIGRFIAGRFGRVCIRLVKIVFVCFVSKVVYMDLFIFY